VESDKYGQEWHDDSSRGPPSSFISDDCLDLTLIHLTIVGVIDWVT
jgi:hypothetical protein